MLYDRILLAKKEGIKLLAVLLDPQKAICTDLDRNVKSIEESCADFIFVGGSDVEKGITHQLVKSLKAKTSKPIVLFPGEVGQITHAADAILFLSLISGRNPEYLIGQQVRSVPFLQDSGLEIIPTGYILVNGGTDTSVRKVSQTVPMDINNVVEISHTARAGIYMGQKLIYLEAGSGAMHPVPKKVIQSVREAIDVPLIVGGGIRSQEKLQEAYRNGADLVVIGTAFEENYKILKKIISNERIH